MSVLLSKLLQKDEVITSKDYFLSVQEDDKLKKIFLNDDASAVKLIFESELSKGVYHPLLRQFIVYTIMKYFSQVVLQTKDQDVKLPNILNWCYEQLKIPTYDLKQVFGALDKDDGFMEFTFKNPLYLQIQKTVFKKDVILTKEVSDIVACMIITDLHVINKPLYEKFKNDYKFQTYDNEAIKRLYKYVDEL